MVELFRPGITSACTRFMRTLCTDGLRSAMRITRTTSGIAAMLLTPTDQMGAVSIKGGETCGSRWKMAVILGNSSFWGNTQNMLQCDNEYAGSDGYTVFIWLHQTNH